MKRVISAIIVLSLVFAFASCTNETASSSERIPIPTESKTESKTQSTDVSSDTASVEEKQNEYTETHLIMTADIHLCKLSWGGISSDARMALMRDEMKEYKNNNGVDALFVLGDLSLDHWESGGSWLSEGVSNTENVINKYLKPTGIKKQYYLPGNHEQYGNEKWKEITGFDRQYSVEIGGYLFLMLDNFAADLDPTEHAHGTRTKTNVRFVQSEMAKHPDMPVVLCAHYFDVEKETGEFWSLVLDKRVVALFCGHDHLTTIEEIGKTGKKIFHLGNFSYTGKAQSLRECHWGWRNVILTKEGIDIDYYMPENTIEEGPMVNPFKETVSQHEFVKNPLAE